MRMYLGGVRFFFGSDYVEMPSAPNGNHALGQSCKQLFGTNLKRLGSSLVIRRAIAHHMECFLIAYRNRSSSSID